jgi:acyl-CoA thioesterase-2
MTTISTEMRGDADPTEGAEASLAELLALLDLERIENDIFRGVSPKDRWQRVFGGQVLGQALVAASRSVEDRTCHSLHAYFLRPGDPSVPIIYNVDRIRDGGSFSTRRVVAIQHGQAIFSMAASFHKHEEGLAHQMKMPDVPPPESLPSEGELKELLFDRLPPQVKAYWERERPIEIRPVDLSRYLAPEKRAATQQMWIRATGTLGDDLALNQCVLAYASDFTLLDTALIAHGRFIFDPSLMLASLDHAIWFHRSFRVDDWLLYAQDSPTSGGGRAFCRGTLFTRSGELVASTTQEGLVRERRVD